MNYLERGSPFTRDLHLKELLEAHGRRCAGRKTGRSALLAAVPEKSQADAQEDAQAEVQSGLSSARLLFLDPKVVRKSGSR